MVGVGKSVLVVVVVSDSVVLLGSSVEDEVVDADDEVALDVTAEDDGEVE